MCEIIAIANQKGGVGKTTTALNLCASMVYFCQEVLLIDIDPQGNATSGLGLNKDELKPNIYDTLLEKVSITDAIYPTEVDWLEIIPSNIDLIGAEVELVNEPDRELRLKRQAAMLRDVYKYVFIDCPPSLGLLTINALTAADYVLIPIQCEYYAMEGLVQLLKAIELVSRNLNQKLEIKGVLLTMYDSRVTLSEQVSNEIRKFFANKVYNTVIPRNIRLAEAPSFGKPVYLYDRNARGSEAYMEFAKEFMGWVIDG